jgi:hypothetical protein
MIDKIVLADGKYTVTHQSGFLNAQRYGEPWRDMTGDNLMFYMTMRILELEERIAEMIYTEERIK